MWESAFSLFEDGDVYDDDDHVFGSGFEGEIWMIA